MTIGPDPDWANRSASGAPAGPSRVCTESCAERSAPELWGPILRPFLGPRSASFEHLKQEYPEQVFLRGRS
eukprot:15468723-Alexandrium_andersonii.AAC.1